MKCSDGCDCYHDQTWSSNVIQCGMRKHAEVPEFIPMDATAVYLDGNNLGDLSGETFIGRKHLSELYLNNSHIHRISNRTLDGLTNLRILHLEHNSLSSLSGGEFAGLPSLTELYLDHNSLEFIHPSTFQPLTNLRILTLANNKLSNFPVWNLNNPALNRVSLAVNPWSCECKFLKEANHFFNNIHVDIEDIDELRYVNFTYF